MAYSGNKFRKKDEFSVDEDLIRLQTFAVRKCQNSRSATMVASSKTNWFEKSRRIWYVSETKTRDTATKQAKTVFGRSFSRSMASNVGKRVTFKSTNALGDAHGVVIGEAKAAPRGLIVIHEWWGMNEQIQEEGAQIAKEGGFTVLVPDMYRGKVAKDREEAGHYMSGLDWNGAVEDISAGANYLISLGCLKVGVTGFCMGGALSFAAAARCPEISAAAPFYGIPNPSLADLTQIRIPVQSHFGELDDVAGFSSPADYNALKEKLVKAGVPHEMHTYPAGHGFTNVNNPNHSADATRLAFSRVYEFMQKHLGASKI